MFVCLLNKLLLVMLSLLVLDCQFVYEIMFSVRRIDVLVCEKKQRVRRTISSHKKVPMKNLAHICTRMRT